MMSSITRTRAKFISLVTLTIIIVFSTTIAKGEGDLGIYCNDTEPCIEHSTCVTDSCVCDTNYFVEGDSCKAKSTLGGPCTGSGSTQCLVDDSECISTKCTCSSTHYESGSSCVSKSTLGGPCTGSGSTQCLVDNSVCISTKCTCSSTHYESGSSCVSKSTLGGPCTGSGSTQCLVDDSECISAKCTCSSTHYESGSSCVSKSTLGGPCTGSGSIQCLVDNSECISTKCTCSSTHYESGSSCVSKSALGGPCTGSGSTQCLVDDSECISTKCTCSSTHYESGSSCVSKSTLGGPCTGSGNTQCSVAGSECIGIKCTCSSTHYESGSSCVSKSTLGGACTGSGSTQCLVANSECIGFKCTCSSTYYQSGSLCMPKSSLGGPCTGSGSTQCLVANSVCITDKCTCSGTHYQSSGSCLLKSTLGGDCTGSGSTQCLVANSECIGFKCTCSSTYYQSGSLCMPKSSLGGPCTGSGSTQCLVANSVCITDKCTCSGTHYQSSGSCLLKSTLGGGCTGSGSTQCSVANSECIGNTCTCSGTHYQSGSFCLLKKVLGEICNAVILCGLSTECSPSYTNGSRYCQCPSGYFDTNGREIGGSCISMSLLQVDSLNIVVQGNSLSATWKHSTHSNSVNFVDHYEVTWSPKDGSNQPMNVDKLTSALITGLVSGETYTVTVTTVNTQSRNEAVKTSVTSSAISVKPATPGPLDMNNSVIQNTSVTLRWKQPDGVVNKYRITLTGVGGAPRESNTSSISISGLTAGKWYNVTITALSSDPVAESDPYQTSIRTLPSQPGPPTDVSCLPMDTYVTLTWLAPTSPNGPNGDITYYLIYVKNGPGSLRTVNSTTPVLKKEIINLTEDSQYTFTVVTVNDGLFQSVESISTTCKTKAGLPLEPQNLSLVSTSSRNLTVSWNKPSDTRGQLIGYRIIAENGTTCAKEILFQCSSCLIKPVLNSSCEAADKNITHMTSEDLEEIAQSLQFINLKPYVDYKVTVKAITETGDGRPSSINILTNEEVPQNITNLMANVLNSTAIEVSWDIPGPRPGITTYIIRVTDDGLTTIPPIAVRGFYERKNIIVNLEEYWQYHISIRAQTDKGLTLEKTTTPEKTRPAAPGKVDSFTVARPSNNYRSVHVSWNIPKLRERNSEITSYIFKHNITDKETSELIQPLGPSTSFQRNLSVTPETYYYIEVFAVNLQNESGSSTSTVYYAEPGPPPNLEQTGVKVVQKDESKASTQNTAYVLLHESQFQDERNGKIVNTGLIVCPKTYIVNLQSRQSTDFDGFTKWKDVKGTGFKSCYRPTNKTWLQQARTVTVRKRSTHERKSYVIGQDAGCDTRNDFCNGPLNPGTDYKVYIFVCTKGGCTESTSIIINTIPVPDELPVGIIAGVAAGVVVLVIVFVIVAVFLKKRKARKGTTHKKFDELDDVIDPTENIVKNRPFQLTDCAAKVADLHRDANLKFAAEYEDIKALSPKHEVEAAELDQNRLKNRYVNILPFDHSRVKLLPTDDDPCTDFINANYLPGYNSQREYIGTQGPIPGTIDDFWRMVWEQNVGIIVMLTLLKEEGRIKCECYWPTEKNDPKQYGELVVETISYSTVNFYDFRIFKLKLGDKTRTLKHFHFLNWKDFSANVQNDVMIDFIQNVRSHVQPPDKQGPIIVHCSAGVGRTGTYICLDHLMQFIDEHDLNTNIDIFDLVLKLRENRSFMVQTEQQYVFIHDCVKDIVERKRVALQNQGGDDLYINQENLYENRAFEPEENLYQNVTVGGDPKTEL